MEVPASRAPMDIDSADDKILRARLETPSNEDTISKLE
jgi:hypothetical protein